jgi:hypothetical protein
MRTLRTRSMLIPFCFIIAQASAQAYYPGGLGNSNLFLWLDASKSSSITLNGATQVSQWADLSGKGYNFSQATSGNQPTYSTTGSPSGRPGITFTSTSSQYLSLASLPATISFTNGFTGFNQVSYSATQTTQGWQRIFDFGNGTGSNNFMMGRYGNSANTYYESWNGGSGDQTWTTTNPIVNGSENLYEAVQTGGTAGNLTAVSHYLAGAGQAASGAAGSSSTHVPNAIARTSNYIGRSNWAADNYFSGTMSEILLYDTAFTTTQRVILENYLSAKWNQTVSVSQYTPPTATSYTTNLVGIGYTSAADNFTVDVSGSTDGLGFSSGATAADFLSAAGYVMAAHNGQTNTVITNATVPGITSAGALTRWNRSWDVQRTGGNSSGAVTLNFNFPDYNGGSFNTGNTFALLYNATDGTFATGTNKLISTLSTTATAAIVSFKVTASNVANGYYTILYSNSPISLPVTLTGFTATAQGRTALLQWTTTAQTGFSHFTVERSGDGTNFSGIGTIAAAANTSLIEQYSFTDNGPLPGTNYYRLALVDLDGTTTWSTIHPVNFGAAASLSVYPNPVVSQLHLVLTDAAGAIAIRLLNTRGQSLRILNAVAPATLDIPMTGLAKGIYFLTIDGDQGHEVHEVRKD